VVARRAGVLEGTGCGPGQILPLAADVTEREKAEVTVARTAGRFGGTDVVFNNASYGAFGAAGAASAARAKGTSDANVHGVLNVLRATMPFLHRQGSGHIFQGSCCPGPASVPGRGLLSATTYAAEGLSDMLTAGLRRRESR
jgi:NADP-dependent 3-hydroxy acid dehydrogenase YdfG